MIATGLVLFVLGILVFRMSAPSDPIAYMREMMNEPSLVRGVAALVAIIGFLVMIAGAVVWAWRNLP